MKNYEAMFLLDSGYASANWDAAVKEIVGILERRSCEIIRLVKWDDRRLAYEILHHRRGTYVLSYFRAPNDALAQIERDVQLSETILRLLIIRRDRITEQQMLSQRIPSGEANIIGEAPKPPEPVAVEAAPPAAETKAGQEAAEATTAPAEAEAGQEATAPAEAKAGQEATATEQIAAEKAETPEPTAEADPVPEAPTTEA